jgi:hypothetical protein
MEYWVLTRFRDCLRALDKGYDACGVDLYSDPSPFFCGNFWWATCRHVNRLPDVASLDVSNRFQAEYWIGKDPEWRPVMCWNRTLAFPYETRFPKEIYEGQRGGCLAVVEGEEEEGERGSLVRGERVCLGPECASSGGAMMRNARAHMGVVW